MKKISSKCRKMQRLQEKNLQIFLQKNRIKNKSLSELTQKDWNFLYKNHIINGCGGNIRDWRFDTFFANIFAKISQILAKILAPLFFEASCNKHDFGYWKGGDETRRKECDEKFLQAILEDIENISENFLKKIFYKIIAYLFYFAVRLGGRKYFNYY